MNLMLLGSVLYIFIFGVVLYVLYASYMDHLIIEDLSALSLGDSDSSLSAIPQGSIREGYSKSSVPWLPSYSDPLVSECYFSAVQQDLLLAPTCWDLLKEFTNSYYFSGPCFYPWESRHYGLGYKYLICEMATNYIHIPELLLSERDFSSAQVVISIVKGVTLPEYYNMVSDSVWDKYAAELNEARKSAFTWTDPSFYWMSGDTYSFNPTFKTSLFLAYNEFPKEVHDTFWNEVRDMNEELAARCYTYWENNNSWGYYLGKSYHELKPFVFSVYTNNPTFIFIDFYCSVFKHFDDYQINLVHNHLGKPVYFDFPNMATTISAHSSSPWYAGTDEVIMKGYEHFNYYQVNVPYMTWMQEELIAKSDYNIHNSEEMLTQEISGKRNEQYKFLVNSDEDTLSFINDYNDVYIPFLHKLSLYTCLYAVSFFLLYIFFNLFYGFLLELSTSLLKVFSVIFGCNGVLFFAAFVTVIWVFLLLLI